MTIIYMDIFFLFNLLFNSILLFVTMKIAKKSVKKIRFINGVLFATAYAFIDVYLYSFVLSIIFNFCSAILIIWITFGKRKWLKHVGLFYFLTFILGGMILAFHSFLPTMQKMVSFLLIVPNYKGTEISITVIFIGLILFMLLVRWQMNEHSRMVFHEAYSYKVQIHLNGKSLQTDGFLDSGNQLIDPLSNRPVMIAEELYVRQFFQEKEWDMLSVACQTHNLSILKGRMKKMIQLIPYQGVRGEGDVLYALQPDKVTIVHSDGTYETSRVLLGIQFGTLTNDEAYQCLLHPDILNIHGVQVAS